MSVTTAILGASGYAGQEVLDRVLAHPELELVALGLTPRGQTRRGARSAPRGRRAGVRRQRRALAAGGELVFLLPRPRTGGLARTARGCGRLTLGCARLAQPGLYPDWYGFEHPLPATLCDWDYALPELFPPIGSLIANPGCYATAVLLLVPLRGSIDPAAGVVVDAKSGVSGAGGR